MPSNISLTASPTTVAPGGVSTITVGMTLTPAHTATLSLKEGTAPLASATVQVSAEAFPPIKLVGDPTITPTDYVLSVDVGTLAATSNPAVFSLQE